MKKKNIIAIILIISLVLSLGVLVTPSKADEVASGTCGDDLAWTLDSDGVLTVSGTGDMDDFTNTSRPWYSYRSSIKTVVIEDGVTSVGQYAFYNCAALDTLKLPDTLTSIGAYAFGYTSITSLIIPDSVTEIGRTAFFYCDELVSLTLSENLTEIEQSTFAYCKSLTEVIIPDSVTYISASVFYQCSSITDVSFGSGLETIGKSAFGYCTSLTSVSVPDNVISIGDSAFIDCDNIEEVYIGSGVSDMDPASAFCRCTSLESFTISSDNEYYIAIDDVVYDYDRTTLLYYSSGKEDEVYIIPGGVTTVGIMAFECADHLVSVTIPPTVTEILEYGFYSCDRLENVMIAEGLETIGYYAFFECVSLTEIVLPSTLTKIGGRAFDESSLTTIYFKGDAPSYTVSTLAYADYKKTTFLPIDMGTITAYYPAENETWTEEVRSEIAGDFDVEWIAY